MSATLPIETSTRTVIRTASVYGQTAFTFDFPVQKALDLRVEVAIAAAPDAWTTLDFAAGEWSIEGLGVAAGGTVTLAVGRAIGDRVRLTGATVLERTSSVTSGGQFRAEALDADLDRALLVAQEARRDIDALAVMDVAEARASALASAERAEVAEAAVLGADEIVSALVDNAESAATAASASETAAAGSAAAAEASATAASVSATQAASVALVRVATWAELSVIASTVDHQAADVVGPDAGTHTDPVTAATVDNEGLYTVAAAASSAWQRIGARWMAPASETEAAARARDDRTITPLSAGWAIEAATAEIAAIEATTADQDRAVSVLDEAGNMTWLDADSAGDPTAQAMARIGARISETNTPALASAGQVDLGSDADISIAFVDENGTATFLAAGADGAPTARAAALIGRTLTADNTPNLSSGGSSILEGRQVASGPAIACLGDSLTAGAGGTPTPTYLAGLTGRTVYNLGVGGETSRTITARIGARPMLATISGGSIPASGGVTVTLAGDDGGVAPLLQGDGGLNPVTIAGVSGTLAYASGVYSFTRTVAGTAVTVLFPAPVMPANAARRSDIFITEMGQNDGTSDPTDVIARLAAIEDWLTPLRPRLLVVGKSTGTTSSRATWTAGLLRAFGRRSVDIGAWLSSEAAMDYVGLTPTSDDLTSMASGAVPASLRSDDTHLNSYGYSAKAWVEYQRLLELGWIE